MKEENELKPYKDLIDAQEILLDIYDRMINWKDYQTFKDHKARVTKLRSRIEQLKNELKP